MGSIDLEESFVEHKLIHYQQRYNWDCGIACIVMLLQQHYRKNLQENFLSICEEEGLNKSIWTIDLCHILHRFEVPHTMFTITIGVNKDFGGQGYYTENLSVDRERVLSRFSRASSHNLQICEGSLSTRQLLRHLVTGPAVVLVDATLLVCSLCKYNKLAIEFRSCLPKARQYTGHYIVLVGFNLHKGKFLYRNPSFSDRLCAVSFHDLDRARKSFGTDQDTIIVHRSYR